MKKNQGRREFLKTSLLGLATADILTDRKISKKAEAKGRKRAEEFVSDRTPSWPELLENEREKREHGQRMDDYITLKKLNIPHNYNELIMPDSELVEEVKVEEIRLDEPIVDADLEYKTDEENYGRADLWRDAEAGIKRKYVDCEDAAIIHQSILEQEDIPSRIVLGESNVGGHAVTEFEYDDEIYCLPGGRGNLSTPVERESYLSGFDPMAYFTSEEPLKVYEEDYF